MHADYKYLEASVWYRTFQFHIFWSDSRCHDRLLSG